MEPPIFDVLGIKSADSEDLGKILDLLREYTSKLRDVCENRLSSYYHRLSTLTVTLLAFCALVSVLTLDILRRLGFRDENYGEITEVFGAFIMLVAAFFPLRYILNRRFRLPTSFDADQIATTVEQMIHIASQYGEHASQRIGNKFEYDLRLAEAEAVLRMYEQVFRPSRRR